jgi:hypothetical protein
MDLYRERLRPSWWMVVATGLFLPATTLIFLPLSISLGLGVGAALWGGSVGLLWVLSPTISTDGQMIRAGRAQVDRQFVRGLEAFYKEGARQERGPRLDARAWLVIRPWVDPVIKVTLQDPRDPTPYWIVSSRHPERFVAAWKAGDTT